MPTTNVGKIVIFESNMYFWNGTTYEKVLKVSDLPGLVTEEELAWLTQDIEDALVNANTPSETNPYATIDDINAIVFPDPITVVANYAALPDPTTVGGDFYWAENSQGSSWLPGSLGGTYYPKGMYYSNGISWSYLETPYQATQLEVDTGTNNDKFVTPLTGKTAYSFKPGIAGGQLLNGGINASENLTLSSTANATKGSIIFGDSRYNESTNRLILGAATGTGRINLPDAGTTSADGIWFGNISLYRASSTLLRTSNDLRVDGGFNCASATNSFSGTGYALNAIPLTGSSATSALSISQTWNTTGNPSAIFLNITNTASGASANLMDLQVGGVSQFKIGKAGETTFFGGGFVNIFKGIKIGNATGSSTGMLIQDNQTSGGGANIWSNGAGRYFWSNTGTGFYNSGSPDIAIGRHGVNILGVYTTNTSTNLAGIAANNLNLGVTTGTGRINLPDTGTTAADGIVFGNISLFRSSANTVTLNGNLVATTSLLTNTITSITGSALINFNLLSGINLTPTTLTGSSATSALSISQTYNTTGTPTTIDVNITDTASNAASLFVNLRRNGSTVFSVSKTGIINLLNSGSGLSFYGQGVFFNTSGRDLDLHLGNATSGKLRLTGSPSIEAVITDYSAYSILSTTTASVNSQILNGQTITNVLGFGAFTGVSYNGLRINTTFSPTSGTHTYVGNLINPTINQTGGANGITRGLFINPTLTAASDFRAIEIGNNSGYGIFQSGASVINQFEGRINFGTTTGTGRINLPDAGTTAADGIAFGTVASIYKNAAGGLFYDSNNSQFFRIGASAIMIIEGSLVDFRRSLVLQPSTLTGSSATSALNISQTWNTTGNPSAINLDITNTASGVSANFIDFKLGGVSQFNVTKNGQITVINNPAIIHGSGVFQLIHGGVQNFRSNSNGTTIGTGGLFASARLAVVSTTQGFLPPVMTATQASAISSPAEGLMLYVTDTNGTFTSKGWWGWNGASWERLNN